MEKEPVEDQNKRNIDRELDHLEKLIAELKVTYEQFFSGYVHQPPEKERADVVRMIRTLHSSPFKNTANNFRLNSLNNRLQTYATYWQRVEKQKENGTYKKDVFKANLTTRNRREMQRAQTSAGAAEKGIKQLFQSYEKALRKTNGNTSGLDYNAFKRSLIKKGEAVKKSTGAGGVGYQIVIANGKVKVKANPKK